MNIEYTCIEADEAAELDKPDSSAPRRSLFISRKKQGSQTIRIGLEAKIGGEVLSVGDLEIVIEDPDKPVPTGGGRETVLPGITITAGGSEESDE